MLSEYNGNNLIENGILYFYSSWVSSCNVPKDNLNFINNNLKNVDIQKINTTKYYNIKKNFEIKTIPSFALIKNNKIIAKLDGMSNKITLNKWIVEHLN